MNEPSHAVIFDLDGVLVDTAQFHLAAWRRIAADHGFEFGDEIAESLKGVGREAALRLVMEAGGITLTPDEVTSTAARKNSYYQSHLAHLDRSALLPGATAALDWLKAHDIPMALASASRNARTILHSTGIESYFAAVLDGMAVPIPKPDPAVFLAAVAALDVPASACVVFEDAIAGIEGAHRAGCRVIGVGDGAVLRAADSVVVSLAEVNWPALFSKGR